MTPDQLEAYQALLGSRRSAARRDAIISGAAFLLFAITLFAVGMLNADTGADRSLLLMGMLTLAFAISFLKAWVRLQTIEASEELLAALRRSAEASSRYDA